MRHLRVKRPGPRTTVEDLGRLRVARFGVPPGGAFDALSLVAANRLVGNRDGLAGLELTLLGPVLDNTGDESIVAALVGAEIDATVAHAGGSQTTPAGTAFEIPPGATLRLGLPLRAARAWLGFAGGIDVPSVLGSRGTCVPGAFGGLDGRALAAGDTLPLGPAKRPARPDAWHDPARTDASPSTLGILAGPQQHLFAPDVIDRLCSIPWSVQPTSDRTGVRLATSEGHAGAGLEAPPGIAPEGTTLGAIQLPPGGDPIVLGPDRPITGGYAKPAVVVRAHLGRLARVRPGETVRLVATSLDEALELERDRRASLPEEQDG